MSIHSDGKPAAVSPDIHHDHAEAFQVDSDVSISLQGRNESSQPWIDCESKGEHREEWGEAIDEQEEPSFLLPEEARDRNEPQRPCAFVVTSGPFVEYSGLAAVDSPMLDVDVSMNESCSSVSEDQASELESCSSVEDHASELDSLEDSQSLADDFQEAEATLQAAEDLMSSMKATNQALRMYAEAIESQSSRSQKQQGNRQP